MRLGSHFEDGVLHVLFDGELDHHVAKKTVSFIEEKIDAHLPRQTVLDMKRLTFMDSSGIAVVLKTYRRMKQTDGNMRVINVGKQPRRVLDAAGVERIVKINTPAKEA